MEGVLIPSRDSDGDGKVRKRAKVILRFLQRNVRSDMEGVLIGDLDMNGKVEKRVKVMKMRSKVAIVNRRLQEEGNVEGKAEAKMRA